MAAFGCFPQASQLLAATVLWLVAQVPLAGAQPGTTGPGTVPQQQRVAIANRLTTLFPSLTITAVDAPIVLGDADPLIFKITPSGRPQFGEFFPREEYQFRYYPNDSFAFGAYFCRLAQEFVVERRRQEANFLVPEFSPGGSVGAPGGVDIPVQNAAELLRSAFFAILSLWDYALDIQYGRFRILVRGFADQSVPFSRPFQPAGRVTLDYLPTVTPHLLLYDEPPFKRTVGPNYSNTDLPELRASFVKAIVDGFLSSCRLQASLTPSSQVLEGAVVPVRDPQFRTFEIFFYAHR